MNLRYAIVGSGAIGGYYGGRLANSGCDVHFLFNTEYEHVVQNGLRVDSVKGDFVINPINAYHSTADMPKCDVVLVGLKTTQNHLLPQILPPLLKPDTLVVLIQNGLGLEANLASALQTKYQDNNRRISFARRGVPRTRLKKPKNLAKITDYPSEFWQDFIFHSKQ